MLKRLTVNQGYLQKLQLADEILQVGWPGTLPPRQLPKHRSPPFSSSKNNAILIIGVGYRTSTNKKQMKK